MPIALCTGYRGDGVIHRGSDLDGSFDLELTADQAPYGAEPDTEPVPVVNDQKEPLGKRRQSADNSVAVVFFCMGAIKQIDVEFAERGVVNRSEIPIDDTKARGNAGCGGHELISRPAELGPVIDTHALSGVAVQSGADSRSLPRADFQIARGGKTRYDEVDECPVFTTGKALHSLNAFRKMRGIANHLAVGIAKKASLCAIREVSGMRGGATRSGKTDPHTHRAFLNDSRGDPHTVPE